MRHNDHIDDLSAQKTGTFGDVHYLLVLRQNGIVFPNTANFGEIESFGAECTK
jgi:hypothetical protein